MGALLSTLAVIVLSIGADHLITAMNRLEASKNKLTTDQILSRLKGIVSQVNQIDSSAASRMNSIIGASPYAAAWSSTARDFVARGNAKASKMIQETEQKIASRDLINERISTFASQPDSYKVSLTGQNDLADIEQAVNKSAAGYGQQDAYTGWRSAGSKKQ